MTIADGEREIKIVWYRPCDDSRVGSGPGRDRVWNTERAETLGAILAALAVFAIIGGGLYWWFLPPAPDELAEGFAPHIDAYLEQTKLIVDQHGDSVIPSPPLGVKTVAIDVRNRTLDAIHAILPDRYRALSSADVNTVVLVDCERKHVGSYGGFNEAYSVNCQLQSFDLKLKRMVWHAGSRNSPPQSLWFRIPFVDVVADRPNQSMVDLLVRQTHALE